MNESGIKPVGPRVLVYPLPVEKTTASGIVIADATTGKEQFAQIEAEVVECGSEAWYDSAEPWAQEGEKVLIGKFTGLLRKGEDGKDYRIIQDRDIIAVVE